MSKVTVEEIARDPRGFLKRVEAGEALMIVQADMPLAEVKPLARSAGELRPFGLCAGEFCVSEGFDEPLPEEVLSLFEGR
ncbi:MAG: type II toxin-antitoxin system Phd/YefM family antitoxin [Deinococcota bacterium]|nr:type II toxin-antitoxin system Phd/YefM family antitoxin [Deinococcota bacterium]